ncbi:hypothetical protein A2997_00535 [Candidatus Nomurabacteria bacterium RIFCSPLOWO2_01_FULL_36_10b]|uniref:Uncharacterized protein n=1 Tax=Candidatus Nomurabacteria bacterium RIFCSPLOWO2_01_FULL_36_10b TaxID=1801766 RepID=A0A1F6WQE1_9BACT|nr:MAG: hypothetical protein A2997_00535 [Candidatus Nomurabacteria bacterium RIFCSPLOWO2_01_FULL_36_10b]
MLTQFNEYHVPARGIMKGEKSFCIVTPECVVAYNSEENQFHIGSSEKVENALSYIHDKARNKK